MAIHTVIIDLTDNQEIILAEILAKGGTKTIDDVCQEKADEMIMGQIKQWISDELKRVIVESDPADKLVEMKVAYLQNAKLINAEIL